MNPTQNVQDQPKTNLQQPRNDLQTGTSTNMTSPNFQQDQLVAPQLKVGNETVGRSGVVQPVSNETAAHHAYFLIPGLLAMLIVIAIVAWPEKKQVPAPTVEEQVEPAPKKATPKTKKKTTAAKRKKSKRK